MKTFAVWVEFRIKSEMLAEFARLVADNASISLRTEPGCKRFDVLTSTHHESPCIALYELYDSEASFRQHATSSHFRAFAEATEPMVESKVVRTFNLDDRI